MFPVGVVAAGLVAGVVGQGWYRWLIREDGPVENLQVLVCLAAAVGAALLARDGWVRDRVVSAASFAGVALALLCVAGEEISWGQRVFGWETPAALTEINRQGETNLHNLFAVEPLFRRALNALVLCGGVLLLLGRRARAWGFPRAVLAPYVLLPLIRLLVWLVYEPPARYHVAWTESAELMELVVYAGIFVAIALTLRVRRA